MRAAVYHGRRDVRIEEVPTPDPGPGELLVRVTAVGICGTDAQEYDSGPHMFPIDRPHPVTGHVGPMVLGHEFTGRVESLAEGVSGFRVGSLVVSGAGVSCGQCSWCGRGRTNLCERYSTIGLQRHGALAEYVAVPAATCVDVSGSGLSPGVLALAQPMSIAVHSMRRGRLEPGDVAVVIGAGGIGAFLTHAAATLGATVVVSDIDARRVRAARRLGAAHAVEAGDASSIAAALERAGLVPTVVYEVTGTAGGLGSALGVLARGTRLVQVGHQAAPREIDLPVLTLDELEVIGSNAHVLVDDLPEALRLLASRAGGWSDVAPTVFPLDGLVDQLELLARGESDRIKTLIDPWGSEVRSTGGPASGNRR
jgi:(R,R)-butanediol dehydrogenase/meso-butanediol dehydrogenase/diacetyl reductase